MTTNTSNNDEPRYKVTITIEDKSDTNITFKMKFKPKLDIKGKTTNAVNYAVKCLDFIKLEKAKEDTK
jgi:hypothetical protein